MKVVTIILAFLFAFSCVKTPDVIVSKPRLFMGGVNTFHWVPSDRIEFFDAARVYMSWEWFEAQDGKFRFSPSAGASGNYDQYLSDLKHYGVEPVLCINQTPEWLRPGQTDPDVAPVGREDMGDPFAYRYAARMYYQFAARYGRTQVGRQKIMVDTTERWTNEGPNKVISGAGVLKYIEVWNEPDKWWKKGTSAYFEPEQYAAMLSACYDGHEGRLGDGYGIKTADPLMQVVMGGLSDFDTAYVSRMALWFSVHRKDRKFAADVVNYHHYCNADGGIFTGKDYGVAPEMDNMKDRLLTVRKHSYNICRNLPVWWSEFGYDTEIKANSPQYAHPDSAAVWLVSSMRIAKDAGIQATFIYNAIDENTPENWLFQSSGIMYGMASERRLEGKPSYMALKRFSEGER